MSETPNTTPAVWPLGGRVLDPSFDSRVPNAELYTLPNGMRVMIMVDAQDRGTLAKLMVNAGSLHQDPNLRGVPHFVEHMVFQGTKLFKDSRQATDYLNDFNITNNGYTSQDKQEFFVESDNDLESLEAAFNFLSQTTLHATLPSGKVIKERAVVLAERLASESEPMDVAMEAFSQHMYGNDHAMGGGGILGAKEDIKKFNPEVVEDFYHKYFHPKNMFLMIVGGAAAAIYRAMVEKYFNVENGKAWTPNPYIGQPRQVKPSDFQLHQDFQHINSAVGFYYPNETVDFATPKYYALQIATEILSQRVFLDLRDEQGLAYSVGAVLHDVDHGYFFSITGEFPKESYAEAKPQMYKYLMELTEKPILEVEYKRAIRKFKSTRWARSARRIADFVADWYFDHGQLVSPEAFIADYDALSLDQVNDLTAGLLSQGAVETLEVGPLK